jgi:hypothetical protein
MLLLQLLAPESFGLVVCSEWLELTELPKFDTAMTSVLFRNDFLNLISDPGFLVSMRNSATINSSRRYMWLSLRNISIREIEYFLNQSTEMNDLFLFLNPKIFLSVRTLSTKRYDQRSDLLMCHGMVQVISNRCANLETLHLINCTFSNISIPPTCTVDTLHKLKHIIIKALRGDDKIIGKLVQNSTNIQTLAVWQRRGSGSLDNMFSGVSNGSRFSLRELKIDHYTHMSIDITVPILCKFLNLKTLKLFKVTATTESLQLLAEHFRLLSDLSVCREETDINDSSGILCFLSSCKLITKLDVSCSSGINDVFLKLVAIHCIELKYFNATKCTPGFTAKGVSNMLNNGCDKIEILFLQTSMRLHLLSDKPFHVSNSRKKDNLTKLSLANTHFYTTDIHKILQHCVNLRELDLSCNINLNDAIVTVIFENCPHLVQLDITRCGFYLTQIAKHYMLQNIPSLQIVRAIESEK